MGWRCVGSGMARRCVARALLAGAFTCNGPTLRAATPTRARRRRMALFGQRRRDRVRRGTAGRRCRACDRRRGMVVRPAPRRDAARARLRRLLARFPGREHGRLALPDAVRRSGAPRVRARSARTDARRRVRRGPALRRRQSLRRRPLHPRATRARRACCRPTAFPAAAGSAAAWRRARDERARAWPPPARACCSRRRSVAAGRRRARDGARRLPATGSAPGPVGFGAPFSVRATLACGAAGGRIAWRQIAGPTVQGGAAQTDGLTFTAHMPSITDARTDARGAPLPWGVVPLSPATRGEVVLEATWTGDGGRAAAGRGARRGGQPLGRPAEHARGRPHPPGRRRMARPGAPRRQHGHARPRHAGRRGQPATRRGRRLAARGRRRARARAAHGTLRRDAARLRARRLPRGHRGGRGAQPDDHRHGARPRTDARRRSRVRPGLPHVRDRLPRHRRARRQRRRLRPRRGRAGRSRRRSAGRGTSCPGRCAGWAASVASPATDRRRFPKRPRAGACCAPTFAPPATTRRRATATSRPGAARAMARADRDARARSERACARCHTTWGFLETIERMPGERDRRVDRRPPAHAGEVGHHVRGLPRRARSRHRGPRRSAAAHPAGAALLALEPRQADQRLPPLPHARPRRGRAARLGRGVDVRARRPGPGERSPLTGAPAHASVTGGCVGCHRGGPATVERGAGHAFQAPPAVCAPCHPGQLPASDLPQQARRLWDRWRGAADTPTATFPHAAGASAALDLGTPVGRALWNVLLVLEDPAAAAHNAGYARALLAAAAPVLATRGRP